MVRKLKKGGDDQEQVAEEATASTADEVPNENSHLACGVQLRSVRMEQGLSTQTVAKQLRLSSKQIEALEQDDFATLPEPTIVKGFIRNYAKLLKIPADTMLAAYAEMTPEIAPYAVGINPGINMKMIEVKKSSGLRYWILAMLLLLCLGVWVFYQSYIQKPDIAHSVADSTKTLPALQIPSNGEKPVLPEIPARGELSSEMLQDEVASTQVGAEKPAPAVIETVEEEGLAAADEPLVEQGKVRLEFNASQETWFSVVNQKNKEVYNKILYEGDSEVIDVAQPLEVVVGNARGATLIVNGKPMDLAPYTHANVAHVPLNQ